MKRRKRSTRTAEEQPMTRAEVIAEVIAEGRATVERLNVAVEQYVHSRDLDTERDAK